MEIFVVARTQETSELRASPCQRQPPEPYYTLAALARALHGRHELHLLLEAVGQLLEAMEALELLGRCLGVVALPQDRHAHDARILPECRARHEAVVVGLALAKVRLHLPSRPCLRDCKSGKSTGHAL
eukprot:8073122-Alexandrium_andersonii.AAC.1